MKTLKILIILIGIGFLLVSCTPSKPATSNEAYLVIDVTASAENKNHPLNLTTDKIIQLFELDTKPMASVKYSQSIISDVHLNQVFTTELASANSANFNKYRRKNTIKKFVTKVANAIDELENSAYDRQSSNIFIPLANLINSVAKNDGDNQLVIIQSDMLNNSREFSSYNKKHLQQLEKSPEFLTEILEKYAPVTMSLGKMKIIIVYQPNAKTDYIFRLISEQYKAYLESKGATVEIAANL
jgi:hypothetical protein